MGSSIGEFLKEEGIFEDAQALAIEKVVTWNLNEDQFPVDQRPKDPSRRSYSKS